MKITVYSSQNSFSLPQLFKEIVLGFLEGRELAWRLFVRDIKASYKKSFLGILWIFIPPLLTAGIWIFLNGQEIVSIDNTPMKYPAFVLAGTILWSFFAEAMVKPIQRFQGAMSMMSKLNFPRESLILASVYDQLFSLSAKLLILIPVLAFYGYFPDWTWLASIIGIFGLLIVGIAIGLFLSPMGLLYNDIGKAIPMVLPFVMYLSPVIYPLRASGKFAFLQGINPVTPFLELSRSGLGGYEFTLFTPLWIWSILIGVLLLFSLVVIKISLPIVVERNGS